MSYQHNVRLATDTKLRHFELWNMCLTLSDGHTIHEFSQRCLTADWPAPQESDYSRMSSKVSSNSLPSYIKATRPVLEIFKMAWYFPDRPRNLTQRRRNVVVLKQTVYLANLNTTHSLSFFVYPFLSPADSARVSPCTGKTTEYLLYLLTADEPLRFNLSVIRASADLYIRRASRK